MIRTLNDTAIDQNHLVRVGRLGQIGSFAAVDRTCYPRRARVIVRSERGLEVGEVLAAPGPVGVRSTAGESSISIAASIPTTTPITGAILRGMTEADELLALRL